MATRTWSLAAAFRAVAGVVLGCAAVTAYEATKATGSDRWWLTASVVLGVAASVGVLMLGAVLARQLTLLAAGLDRLAGGDLGVRLEVGGPAELAAIGHAVTRLAQLWAVACTGVGAVRDALRTSAADLDGITAAVRSGAMQTSEMFVGVQSSADAVVQNIQVIASASEQMGSAIAEISQNAQEASQVASGAVQAVEVTTRTMSTLGDSSREIGDVVRLITSIAEQTNLLALNATIEAARAGDAGKGFAVVADEVKQLAQETARATEDISRRVETIQGDADQAAQAISGIADVIARIDEFQTTIAGAVEEQTATSRSINVGVTEAARDSGAIARSVSSRLGAASSAAASMQRAGQSAQELAAMSAELSRVIGAFRQP
jgi:methyl-accepting chemotaxis protein